MKPYVIDNHFITADCGNTSGALCQVCIYFGKDAVGPFSLLVLCLCCGVFSTYMCNVTVLITFCKTLIFSYENKQKIEMFLVIVRLFYPAVVKYIHVTELSSR